MDAVAAPFLPRVPMASLPWQCVVDYDPLYLELWLSKLDEEENEVALPGKVRKAEVRTVRKLRSRSRHAQAAAVANSCDFSADVQIYNFS